MSGHGLSVVPTPHNPLLLQLEPEVLTAGLLGKENYLH